MAPPQKRKAQRPRNRFYRGAKISEYRFKKILWCFAKDMSPTEVSQQMHLSLNTVNSLYIKIRTYFTQVGLFNDPFETSSEPSEIDEHLEFQFLDFHLKRVARKRGLSYLNYGADELDYHLFESEWRFLYFLFSGAAADDRDETVTTMMFNDLTSIIKICGPIGATPKNSELGLQYLDDRVSQQCHWLERNSPDFKSPELREKLREIRAIAPRVSRARKAKE